MNLFARPDPDQLLENIKQEQARAARGKLKIFFGACAGVGKTYAMLSAARRQIELGVEVVIGVIETHGRIETATLADGLEHLPKLQLPYRDKLLAEFDLDAALIRQPTLILMDELAHSNIPGSRHPKRWQDVQELLTAGIDVYTTVNVQHLETLNDVVRNITSINVWETVPDHVFDHADEIVLVDLPPDELLQRLQEGKIYLPQQAETAVRNFFRKGNLLALRELSLRRTADRVDDSLLAYRHQTSVETVWPTRDALLVCIGADTESERLIRTSARLALRLEAQWHVLHVETQEHHLERLRVIKTLELANSLGARTTTLTADDRVAAIIDYARRHNLSRVLIGRSSINKFNWFWRCSLAERLSQQADDLEIIRIAQTATPRKSVLSIYSDAAIINWWAYPQTVVICAIAIALTIPLATSIDLTNIAMLLLLAVLLVALSLGSGPAMLAAFLVVAGFDFFFVPPQFSFTFFDAQYFITFNVMLIIALLIGQLTARFKQHARIAKQREARSIALYKIARDLSAALMSTQIVEACERFLQAEFLSSAGLLLMNLEDKLQFIAGPCSIIIDEGVARWAFDHSEAAGLFTNTFPGNKLLYLPLKTSMRTRGVLVIAPQNQVRIQGPEARYQLETLANLVAIAVERMHFVEVAQNTLMQIESEKLRNAFLKIGFNN